MEKQIDRDSCFPLVTGQKGPTKQWMSFHLHYGAQATYFPIIWDRSAPAVGPFFTDANGSIFLDFVSHVGAAPFGYNNPDMIEFLRDMPIMEPMRYAGTDYIASWGKNPKDKEVPTPSHLHHKLRKITKQIGLQKSFFTNSGAEAVENAIKLSYYKRKNRGYIIGFDGAFHGRTLGALSVNRSKSVHKTWFPQIPYVLHLPYCDCAAGRCTCQWMHKGVSALDRMIGHNRGLYKPEEIAAVIIEPIQGEGGYRPASKQMMKDLYNTCRAYDIPLIFDEVQSGMGRTGKWWASEHFGVKPDMMSSAKALRIGATVGKKEFFPEEQGHIASTFGEGNPLASAMGYKTIEIIEKRKLLSNATRMGKYMLKQLQELSDRKRHIEEARGKGLMLALQFDTKKERERVKTAARKRGLLITGAGQKSIRFVPPMDVNKREIDMCMDILRKCV